jgi:hypothetical protein
MKKLVLILCIALSGCMWQTVNSNDIRSAIRICGNMNEVVEISATFLGTETVLCENRKEIMMTSGR